MKREREKAKIMFKCKRMGAYYPERERERKREREREREGQSKR